MHNKMTRRALFISGLGAAFYMLIKYLIPPAAAKNSITIPLSALPENGVYMIRDKKAAIIRRQQDIRAISISCTHLGCTLNVANDEFVCPCHGSVFTLEGNVIKGPATKNLPEYSIELSGDNVVLYI